MSSAAQPSVRHWQIVGGSAAAQPITGGAHESWTLIGSEDTTIELVLDDDYAIILKVGNVGDMNAAGDFQLQYEVNGTGGFADVNATSSNLRSAASGDTEDATSTTENLSTSAETFQTSVLDEVDGLIGTNCGGHEEFEFYFTFNLRGAELTAGAESIELRLTTGGGTFDHTAVEPILITLPALAEPPGAYLPVPKANHTAFKRTLQTLELNEYPQPPPPPVSVAAETPALKANRIEAVRQIQTLGNPHVYPETPLGFFDGQWPSHQPPPTFKVSFDRSLQTLAHNPIYPPTPVGFFEGQWPSHQPPPTLVARFDRDRLKLPELDEYPVTPPDTVPLVVETLTLKASFTRSRQTLAHNPAYPATPVGFFEGFFPGPFRVKRIPTTYGREAQRVLNPHVYPATPDGFWWPKPPPPTFRTDFTRVIQPVLIPPVYPPTPPAFSTSRSPQDPRSFITFKIRSRQFQKVRPAGEFAAPVAPVVPYPSWLPPAANRVSFERHLQALPQLDQRPATPPGFRWPRPPMPTFKVSFNRTRQLLPQLDERPPTPPGFFEGFFPAPVRLKRIAVTYGREAQRVLDPHVYPPTPPGFFDGFWPGSARVESFKVSFDRSLQTPLEIDLYPPPPVSAEDYAGYTPVTKFSWSAKRDLQTLGNPHVYPATPPGFRWPRPPMPTLTTAFVRRLQSLPQLDERPPTPVPAPPQPAVKANRVSFTRHRRALNHNPAYPPTPAGFFDGFWPGSRRVTPLHSAYTRRLAKLPQHDEWPQIPPVPGLTAFFRVKDANKSTFERRLLLPPEHNEYPVTPPSLIEGMAMWPAMPIYRRDIHRTLQPVWDPSASVPPLFIPGLDICWRADPMEIVWTAGGKENTWTASSTGTGWEADCTDTTWEADCADTLWIADPFCD